MFGAPEEIRTPDPLVRSQVLYPAELRAREACIIRELNFISSRKVYFSQRICLFDSKALSGG